MEEVVPGRSFAGKVVSHRFGPLAALCAANLAVSFLLRVVLAVRSASELDGGVLALAGIFLLGLAFDLVQTSYVLAAPALVLAALPEACFRSRAWRFVCWGSAALVFFLLLFDAVSQWLFW